VPEREIHAMKTARTTEVSRETRAPMTRRFARAASAERSIPPLLDQHGQPIWHALRSDNLPEASNETVVLRRDAAFRWALAAADLVAVASTITLFASSAHLRPAVLLLLPIVVLLAKAMGLYERDQYLVHKGTIDETPQLLQLAAVLAIVVWVGEDFFVDGLLGRRQVLGLAAVFFVFTIVGRSVARRIALKATPAERCIVLGNAGSAARIAEKLKSTGSVNATVVGRVALDDGTYRTRPGEPPLLGRSDALVPLLAEYGIQRVLIAPDGHDQEQVIHAIRLTKALGVKVSVLPRLLEAVGSASLFDDVGGLTLLGVRAYGLSRSSELLKRAVDATAAALGLLLISPLMGAIAIAIKLDSRGPVLFGQRRIGRSGSEFHMLKFRSMVADAEGMKDELRARNEADGLFKIKDDPRLTRVGHWLRQMSLDELPQLINVLKGDMSLVGPRPLVPDEDAMIDGWERRRLVVRPGMTGLWQVLGSARIPRHEMVKIDYLYGANWSIWLDAKILLRTVPYVLSRRGM
jgi:exopolysaccharide biosynthesis polyprenyl glycosylphosphotransferase